MLTFFPCPFLLAGCRRDSECEYTEACINKQCQDPCLYQDCGTNAVCEARAHLPTCSCESGFYGDPYRECLRPECQVDDDCPNTLTCRNQKCVDPCNCAENADCDARNHRGYCTCRTGFTGDAYTHGCTPSRAAFFGMLF